MPIGVYPKRPCYLGCGMMLNPRSAHYHEDKCRGPKAPGPPPKSHPKTQDTPRIACIPRPVPVPGWLDQVTVAEVIQELRQASDGCRSAVNLVRIAAERVAKRKGQALVPAALSVSLSDFR